MMPFNKLFWGGKNDWGIFKLVISEVWAVRIITDESWGCCGLGLLQLRDAAVQRCYCLGLLWFRDATAYGCCDLGMLQLEDAAIQRYYCLGFWGLVILQLGDAPVWRCYCLGMIQFRDATV